jgi:glutamate racemase
VIESVMGNSAAYVDSGEAVAEELARLLEERGLRRASDEPPGEKFYVTDSASRFRRVAELFLGRPLESVESVELGSI